MRFITLALSLLLAMPAALAQTGKAPWEEYGKRLKASEEVSPLGPNLFGDNVSLSNGALSFSVTDVSLPGNSGLAVSLSRTYRVQDWRHRVADGMMQDWDIDVPSLSAVHAGSWVDASGGTNRCSNPGAPPSPLQYPGLHAIDFWQGAQLNLPGVSSGELLTPVGTAPKPTTGGPYYWMTNDQVHFSCLSSIQNGTGQGFLAITPDGTKIWFDRMAQYHEPWIRRGSQTVIQGGAPLEYQATIRRNVLLATRVEDRFGNWVTYTYTNAATDRPRLTQITSNDGRQLTISYPSASVDAPVSSVSDGTRTWSYVYGTTSSGRATLTQVTLPDTSKWTINFAAFTNAEILQTEDPQLGETFRTCTMNETPLNSTNQPVGTMTHPSGAIGNFTVSIVQHGRSKVPVTCNNVTVGGSGNDQNDDTPFFPIKYFAYTLKTKSITGPGMTAAQWNYSYTPGTSFVFQAGATPGHPVCDTSQWAACIAPPCQSDLCAGRSITVVTGPGGRWTRYKYGNTFQYDEGKLISVEEGTTTTVLRSTLYSYDLTKDDTSGLPYLRRWGHGQRGNGDSFQAEYHRPQTKVVTTQQGQTFTWQADTFDKFARPLQTTRFSDLTGAPNTRTDVTAYSDFESLWVLGQVAQVTNSNTGQILEKTDYKASNALPEKFYSPGTATSAPQLLQSLTYNADGTIATAKDGRNYTTGLSNWYRGVPQNISFPDGTAQSASVNSLGQITSVTEQIGPSPTQTATTSYQYDNGGRLKKVTYPTGDSTSWAVKNITYVQVAATEHGIDAGHWRQTISQGNYRKYVFFDAMWRPVVEREHDSTNIAGTDRFKRFAYHDTGELAFAAYPGTTSTLTAGLWHEYDVLGRPTRTEQDSENGTLVTQYAYLSGFKTRVTNPRGYLTDTRFQAFDQPSTETPIEIIAAVGRPEQQTTLIAKNVLRQTETLTRSGTYGGSTVSLARQYVYDEQLRLCMRKEPETNTTVYAYDPAGNVAWYAEGRPTNTQACATTRGGVPSSAKITHAYDVRNRIIEVNYPGTVVDVATTYYADGQVNTITAGTSVLTYQYNKRRLLTSEQSQTPFINWTTTHSYSNLGHLGATTYPNGHAVSFAPNALGQATQAGTYATAAMYFPNGALKSFTYGNGLQHTLTLNARQLPERSRDALGTNVVLDDTYDYDNNGNVAGITDALPLQPGNRDMTYDALDRLVGVNAGSAQGGVGTFAYDPLDNIRQLDQGTRTGRHQYDAVTNRLTALKNAAGTTISSYLHDDRGNLTSRTEGGQTHSFTFDTANRLTATSLGASSYEYDGLGRRTRETSGGLATYYQYSRAGQLLYAEDYKTARSHLYIYLSGSLVAKRTLAHADGSLQYSYQHTDALGSLVAATNASGAVQRRERMTAYGEPVDGAWDNGHGFTGHQNDAATKLVYMQQRYYDPILGIFLTPDPVAAMLETGLNQNRYTYANNNPHGFVDPDGRMGVPCLAGQACNRYKDFDWRCQQTCIGKGNADEGYKKRVKRGGLFYDLGNGYEASLDQFNAKGESGHEFHVYRQGQEVGVFKEGEFINKHGKSGLPPGFPEESLDRLKGLDGQVMVRSGRWSLTEARSRAPSLFRPEGKFKKIAKGAGRFFAVVTVVMVATGEMTPSEALGITEAACSSIDPCGASTGEYED